MSGYRRRNRIWGNPKEKSSDSLGSISREGSNDKLNNAIFEGQLTQEQFEEIGNLPQSQFVKETDSESEALLEVVWTAAQCEKSGSKIPLKNILRNVSDPVYKYAAFLLFPLLSKSNLSAFEKPVLVELVYASDFEAGKPKRFFSMQTFGLLDEKGNRPKVQLKDFGTFISNGKIEKRFNGKEEISEIPNGKFPPGTGPYTGNSKEESTFYFMLGEAEYGGIQICFKPLNAASYDCLDEILFWTPKKYRW